MTTTPARNAADVYKNGQLAARLQRTPHGTEFRYDPQYLRNGGPPIASTLPLTDNPRITPAGAVPPYFAGLLPEGRRLSALRRLVKTSADDELSLLLAVGTDTIGDVQVTPVETPLPSEPETLQLPARPEDTRWVDLLEHANITQRPPTIAGVQDKASASMISLPVKQQHERYILKLNPPEYPHLVENEHHFIQWSRTARINTTRARLLRDADNEPALLVTRFDRVADNGATRALAVEDAAQALGIWPADKYNITFEQASLSLMNLCNAPLIAARNVLQQLVFAWLTGNGDLHAKNLSALTTTTRDTRLAPAYDLPSTLPYGDSTLALTVGGRDTLTPRRVTEYANEMGLRQAAVDRVVGSILARTTDLIDSISALPFDSRTRAKVTRQLAARRRDLEKNPN